MEEEIFFTPRRKEFIASGCLNLGLIVLTSGLVNDAFLLFNKKLRFGIVSSGLVLLLLSVFIFPSKGGK